MGEPVTPPFGCPVGEPVGVIVSVGDGDMVIIGLFVGLGFPVGLGAGVVFPQAEIVKSSMIVHNRYVTVFFISIPPK